MTPTPELGRTPAAILVFGSSAAVLVVEIVALRLLAPYLGLTLETSTLVIGVALTAIAVGSWSGGRAADTMPPRRALGPLLAFSGVAVAATPFVVRGAAETAGGVVLLVTATLTIFVPGALLSAVTPMVIKLRLTSLEETGTVVGRLAGIGTTGAIFGTVVTGFVLIATVPVSAILVGLGIALVASAAVVELRVRGWRAATAPAVLVVVGGLGAVVAPGGCDRETPYHCASVEQDPDRPSGRVLVLDGLRHSYVDLDDPTHLEFAYVRAIASALDTALDPAGAPVTAHHLGAGALTVPRYLARTRPGSTSVVSEIDPGVVEIDADRLGVGEEPGLEVRVEDGRLGLGRLPADSRDVVVGDAFGGVSVPWHLTTREAVAEIRRVLARDGVYVVNLIDYGPMDFARAELATLRAGFDHVALAGPVASFADGPGGNVVALASETPLDPGAWAARIEERRTGARGSSDEAWTVLTGAELGRWVGEAPVLTDDRAPVDQLLTPYVAP